MLSTLFLGYPSPLFSGGEWGRGRGGGGVESMNFAYKSGNRTVRDANTTLTFLFQNPPRTGAAATVTRLMCSALLPPSPVAAPWRAEVLFAFLRPTSLSSAARCSD